MKPKRMRMAIWNQSSPRIPRARARRLAGPSASSRPWNCRKNPPPPAIRGSCWTCRRRLRAAAEEQGEKPGNVVVTGNRSRVDEITVTGRQTPSQGIAETPLATTLIKPPPFEKTPETWYAYIEKLRAQGKVEEADRQLARLEKAHPGWLERYLRDSPER